MTPLFFPSHSPSTSGTPPPPPLASYSPSTSVAPFSPSSHPSGASGASSPSNSSVVTLSLTDYTRLVRRLPPLPDVSIFEPFKSPFSSWLQDLMNKAVMEPGWYNRYSLILAHIATRQGWPCIRLFYEIGFNNDSSWEQLIAKLQHFFYRPELRIGFRTNFFRFPPFSVKDFKSGRCLLDFFI